MRSLKLIVAMMIVLLSATTLFAETYKFKGKMNEAKILNKGKIWYVGEGQVKIVKEKGVYYEIWKGGDGSKTRLEPYKNLCLQNKKSGTCITYDDEYKGLIWVNLETMKVEINSNR